MTEQLNHCTTKLFPTIEGALKTIYVRKVGDQYNTENVIFDIITVV